MRCVFGHFRSTLLLGLTALFLFGVFVPIRPAFSMLADGQYTEREKAGFAFYKLARLDPDFKSWIASSDSDDTVAKAKKALTGEQVERLQNGFDIFSSDEDMLKVETTVKISLPKLTPEETKSGFRDQKPVELVIGPAMKTLYFSYELSPDMWIAIIPSNEEQFHTIMVDNATYNKMYSVAHLGPYNRNARAIVKISLRADHVDTTKPMVMDGQNMWLMMATVADFQIWNKDGKVLLWDYSAPWYVSNDSHDILNLYGQ